MAMNYHHQLQLLVDILQNQQDEHYGTHGEYIQVESLANSLIDNHSVPNEVKSLVSNIRQYAKQHDIQEQHANVDISALQQYVSNIQQIESNAQGDSTFM
ncbi:YtzH-like family protein [Bacillus shivajii]|uniref:YtzH-like family protein n=1 Tax=Bacillus shivajii TaxID=1983719 RepID=UPI001CFB6824|nr:YtzH-like family protein [Bacillus shivajii]UCZ52331.1 YtzH-like family protein [Bacillus shivajii]